MTINPSQLLALDNSDNNANQDPFFSFSFLFFKRYFFNFDDLSWLYLWLYTLFGLCAYWKGGNLFISKIKFSIFLKQPFGSMLIEYRIYFFAIFSVVYYHHLSYSWMNRITDKMRVLREKYRLSNNKKKLK